MPVASLIASTKLDPPPRCGEVELAGIPTAARPAHDRFDAYHRALVVGVGLVPLDHRELWVVLERDALVAEVLTELVHALEAADDQPLEVQLGGDPQVEVAVERMVVGREGTGQGAAVERLQDRRLDLDEAIAVERGAHRGDDASAVYEEAAGSSLAIKSSSRWR